MDGKLKYDKALAWQGIFKGKMFTNIICYVILIIMYYSAIKEFVSSPAEYLNMVDQKIVSGEISKQKILLGMLAIYYISSTLIYTFPLNLLDILWDRQIPFKGKCIDTDKKDVSFPKLARGVLVNMRQYYPHSKQYRVSFKIFKDIDIITIVEDGKKTKLCAYKPLKDYIRSISTEQWQGDFTYEDEIEGVCLKNSGLIIGLKLVKELDLGLEN